MSLLDLPSLSSIIRSKEKFGPNDANFLFYYNVVLENIPYLHLSKISLGQVGISFGNVLSIKASNAPTLEKYIRVSSQKDSRSIIR